VADFALFDLFSPALSLIDDVLNNSLALAPVWRIAIFAALGGAASMLLFKRLSNQVELADLKQQIRTVQKELAGADIEPGNVKKIIQRNLKLTGRQLQLTFWPALVASIPILFLLAFSSNQFGVATPESGFRVYVTPKDFQGSPLEFEWLGVNAQWDARGKAWTFRQLEPGQTASLMLGSQKQLSLPTSVPTNVIHKKHWWNYLFANPAGYLDANVSIGLFEFNTPTQIIINWGPGWMRGWVFAFMLFLVLFSVVIKFVWKIH
jgi:uncharacterized membrane protein (DUF106 family)